MITASILELPLVRVFLDVDRTVQIELAVHCPVSDHPKGESTLWWLPLKGTPARERAATWIMQAAFSKSGGLHERVAAGAAMLSAFIGDKRCPECAARKAAHP